METKQIKTSYSTTAGTAYITFDDARAPVGNTLGEEGGGIFVILRSVSLCFQNLQSLYMLSSAVTLTTSDGSCVVHPREVSGG